MDVLLDPQYPMVGKGNSILIGQFHPVTEKFEIKWHNLRLAPNFPLSCVQVMPMDLNEFLFNCLNLEREQVNYWNYKFLEILGSEKSLVFTERYLTPEMEKITLCIQILPLDHSGIIVIVNGI